jgi:putative DNA primase/helicase
MIGAERIARALGGRRSGRGWIARCPAHSDHTPSLSIRNADDNKVLVRCFAGCDQERVIAALRARGLWSGHRSAIRSHINQAGSAKPGEDADAEGKRRHAASIWRASVPAAGTLVETYLASRGLVTPPAPALRFHPALKHRSGGTWPAMVALVTRGTDDASLAVHRTYLARDGAGKAPVDPQKMMIAASRGGAVRIAQPGDVLMVGEGIETCLAAMQASGHPAWAALSTSGLRALDLPDGVHDVIVLADGDDPGEAAARECALRWKRQGRRVRIARPPQGLDFNDLLMGKTPQKQEDGDSQ